MRELHYPGVVDPRATPMYDGYPPITRNGPNTFLWPDLYKRKQQADKIRRCSKILYELGSATPFLIAILQSCVPKPDHYALSLLPCRLICTPVWGSAGE